MCNFVFFYFTVYHTFCQFDLGFVEITFINGILLPEAIINVLVYVFNLVSGNVLVLKKFDNNN